MTEVKKQDRRAFDNNFQVSDFTLGRFDHKAEIGVTRNDLLTPEYWSHVSERMTPYSEVTVRCVDGTFYAKYLVLDCGRGWARLHELGWWNLTTADVAKTQSVAGAVSDYEIVYKGPTRKHIVQRVSDQVVLHEGEARKAGAEEWLKDHLASKGAKNLTDIPA